MEENQRSQLAESLNRGILEAVPGGVVHVSTQGEILTANPEALRILGLSHDELTDKYTADFKTETLFEDGSPCPVEEYPVSRALITGEAQLPVTIGVRRPDGDTSWAVFRAVPIKDPADGGVTGAVVTFLDITARRAAEEEQRELAAQLQHAQRMDTVGQLAGGIAHDFNNLLQVILGNADLAATKDTKGNALAEIKMAAERASELTQQLLAFGRRQHFSPRDLDPNDVIERMTPLLARMLGETIEMRVDPSTDVATVHADRGQLEQVLANLCVNARDAMPDGGAITIGTASIDADSAFRDQHPWATAPRYATIVVTDSGAGIAPEARDRVFEPFFTTKPVGEGSGLGLAVVYGILRQHQGMVEADSDGGGTTMTLYLPAVDRRPEPVTREVNDRGPRGQGTILLVEDEAMVRKLVESVLRDAGYEVLSATNGAQALEILEKRGMQVDLVLSDVVMPDMGGYELHKRVGEVAPNLPFILSSGYAATAASDASNADVPVLQKPYPSATLLEAVANQLAAHRGSGG